MTLFAVKVEGIPFPLLVDAFDIYGAARAVRHAAGDFGTDADNVEVAPLTPYGVGEGEYTSLEWAAGLNNYALQEDGE